MSQLNVNTISPQSGSTISFTGTLSGSDMRLSGDVVAQRYIVSSSVTKLNIVTNSGSTAFGDTLDDTHKYTGSLQITGSVSASRFSGDGGGLTNVFTGTTPSASISTRLTNTEATASNVVSGNVTLTKLTTTGNISSSATATASFGAAHLGAGSYGTDRTMLFVSQSSTTHHGYVFKSAYNTSNSSYSMILKNSAGTTKGAVRHDGYMYMPQYNISTDGSTQQGWLDAGGDSSALRLNANSRALQLASENKKTFTLNTDGTIDITTKLTVNNDLEVTGSISGSATSTGSFGKLELAGSAGTLMRLGATQVAAGANVGDAGARYVFNMSSAAPYVGVGIISQNHTPHQFSILNATYRSDGNFNYGVTLNQNNSGEFDMYVANGLRFSIDTSGNVSSKGSLISTKAAGVISGSLTSTGSFGHIMKGGVNWDTAVSASAAAAGMGGGGASFSDGTATTISGSVASSASFGQLNLVNYNQGKSSTTNTIFGAGIGSHPAGTYDVYIGYQANNTAGNGGSNVGIGYQALGGAVNSYSNTAIGRQALYSMQGNQGVAVGEGAAYDNTAHHITAIGSYALANNTTGTGNVAVGFQSITTNIDGDNNTAIGYQSLKTFEAGSDGQGSNTAVGYHSLYTATTGYANTALGDRAGFLITTGTDNILIGSGSQPSTGSAVNQIVIGTAADGLADNTTVIGNSSTTTTFLHGNTSGSVTSTGSFGSVVAGGAGVNTFTGDVGIGTTSPTLGIDLVANAETSAQFRIADTAASGTKRGKLLGRHHTTDEQNVYIVGYESNNTDNILYVGGVSGAQNAITQFRVYTGATDTTTTGTERFRIDSAGNITGSANLEIAGNISGSVTSTGSFGKLEVDGYQGTVMRVGATQVAAGAAVGDAGARYVFNVDHSAPYVGLGILAQSDFPHQMSILNKTYDSTGNFNNGITFNQANDGAFTMYTPAGKSLMIDPSGNMELMPGTGAAGKGSISGSVFASASFGRFDAADGFYDSGTKLSDYVFEPDYELRSLDEVETFISQSKHLPGVPGQDDIDSWNNMSLGSKQTLFLEKIEELTLYILQLHKRIKELEKP